MPTLDDVAERAGVSVTTISRMLNNRVPVSRETREAIIKAMEELDYRPNELARSLFKKNSQMIGLIIASANNYFYCKIIDRVEHYVSSYGYKLLLCLSNNDKQNEIAYFDMLKANQVAGVILASNTQDLERYVSFKAPLITFDRMLSPHIPAVSSDNYSGGVLAAKHLLEKGCKHPAYIMDTRRMGMHANYRYDGFADTFKKNGIETIVHAVPLECFISLSYVDAISEFFQLYPESDCIFTSNDIIASQVLRYCALHEISVPDQLKVIGYDDIDMASFVTPSLTTIHQPVEDLCRFAVESIINFKERNIPSLTLFPVSLIKREST
jgi:LacI family sucrose operon transcriptional repressor